MNCSHVSDICKPQFWDSLTDLQTSGSIPRGTVIGLKVLDPRVKYAQLFDVVLNTDLASCRFPPKNAKPHYPDVAQTSTQLSSPFIFPTALTAQSEIWDEEKRGSLKKPKYKKKDLDDRRSKAGVTLPFLRSPYTLSICRTSFRVPRSILSVRMIEFPFSSFNVLSNHLQFLQAQHLNPITHKESMGGHCCSLQAGLWLSFPPCCTREPDLLANENA